MSGAALEPWLEPLLDAELMRAVDAWAVDELAIPVAALMERAGAGLAAVAADAIPAGRVAIVCGKGNNGGDGLVAARLLRGAGRRVDVLHAWGDGAGNDEVRAQVARLPGEPPRAWTSGALAGAAGVIDAVLGTGATGALRPPVGEIVRELNAAGVPIVAADVPSGVDASTGEIAEDAVRATVTATFHTGKPGLWISPGKAHAGRVEVLGLGLPPGEPGPPAAGLITPDVLDVVPRRGAASTKFTSGNVVVIGGSRGRTGAPTMSALGAMRAGAGYVTLGIAEALEPVVAGRLLEAMTVPLPGSAEGLAPHALRPAQAALERADALVLGPGMGRAHGAVSFVRELARAAPVPLVLDADGLNAHAGRLPALAGRSAPTVLTPHAGELARLLETDAAAIERARLASARRAAALSNAVVVLKGDDTIVAAPGGRVAISRGGAPALATAGTGDVLAGVLGALLAKRMATWAAVCAAVEAHAEAGRRAALPHGPEGVIASDVIAALPAALARRPVG